MSIFMFRIPIYNFKWPMFKGHQGMLFTGAVILNHFFLQPVEEFPS